MRRDEVLTGLELLLKIAEIEVGKLPAGIQMLLLIENQSLIKVDVS